MTKHQDKTSNETVPKPPKLKIVNVEELDTTATGLSINRNRSALIQSFLDFTDQLEEEIARISKL
jgi:hypothetical protein